MLSASLVPAPRAMLQTIAAVEVAPVVAAAAEGGPRKERVTVAGPDIADARDLVRAWRSVTGKRAPLLPVRVPGKLGKALREGALTAPQPDARGRTPFAAWLQAQPS